MTICKTIPSYRPLFSLIINIGINTTGNIPAYNVEKYLRSCHLSHIVGEKPQVSPSFKSTELVFSSKVRNNPSSGK